MQAGRGEIRGLRVAWCWAQLLFVAVAGALVGCRSGSGEAAVKVADSDVAVTVAISEPDDKGVVYGPEYGELEVMTESLMLASKLYVEEYPFQKLVYNAIDGMLKRMDPSSGFLAPESLELHELETKGYFGGIGVSIGSEGGELKVVSPVEDSPAARAGIQAGEKITAVDGKSLAGGSIDEAVKAMRGEKGTRVKLEVEDSGGVKREVELVRDDIRVSEIKGIRLPGSGMGYVRIGQFDKPTAEEFGRVFDDLNRQKVKGIVLDLRDNPGGLLEAAVGVAECLLPRGKSIVSIRTREGEEKEHLYKAGASSSRNTRVGLAVLVNRGSASAAEVLVGALQSHERGVIVGERTFGKASVQSVIRLGARPECALRLTTAYYYTPDGRQIHGRGIEPDQVVPLARNPWHRVNMRSFLNEVASKSESEGEVMLTGLQDAQLEHAIRILQGKSFEEES